MRKLFILGSERSGSTWLANIFDAHPDVEFIMEPFADYAAIFPDVAGRNIYMKEGDKKSIECVQEGYKGLTGLKYPLFYRRGRSLNWKYLDKIVITGYLFLKKMARKKPSPRYNRYQLLNLNNKEIRIKEQIRKRCEQVLDVIKELRLNFKIGLVSAAFPGSKYLVCIRHPGAQISSVIKLFARESLGELHRALDSFIENIKDNNRFTCYRPMIAKYDAKNNIHELLCLWWFINYDVLFNDLRKSGCEFYTVFHENISENPVAEVKRILDFSGIEMSGHVLAYLERSTRAKAGKNVNLDTNRDSAIHSRETIGSVDTNLEDTIREITREYGLSLDRILQEYLGRFYK